MRGSNPRSRKNLKKGNPATQFKKDDPWTKEIAQMGGEALKNKLIAQEDILARLAQNENDWDEIINNVIERAKTSARDFEVLRDTIGQKPREPVDMQVDTEFRFIVEEPDRNKK